MAPASRRRGGQLDRPPYPDRASAGRRLAADLADYAGREDVLVLALPRGGVPVAAPVAEALEAPLDVVLVRKLGLPGQPELAMGAIATVGGRLAVVRNDEVTNDAHVSEATYSEVCRRESDELRRLDITYRGERAAIAVDGRTVILVDDGLATGSTMRAAVAALRRRAPARLVVAVPIGSPRSCAALAAEVDDLVCPWRPIRFAAVGQGYRDFRPTSTAEVRALLR